MKKMISCLLAVLLLASCCVCAFAEDEITVEKTEIIEEEDTKELLDNFGELFVENEDLQKLAGENGITVNEVLTVEGVIVEPVKLELELEDPTAVSGLVRMVDGKPVTYPANYNSQTGLVEVEIDEPGEYVVARRVIDYRTVTRTVYEEQMTTVMIDSVEYELEEFESTVFVIVPVDDAHMMNKEDREALEEAVEDINLNYEKITATYESFANTAPANSFYIPAFTEEQEDMLPIRQRMKIPDPDIFGGLLVKTEDGWQEVEAAIDADGYLVFNLEVAGTYVIMSQAA